MHIHTTFPERPERVVQTRALGSPGALLLFILSLILSFPSGLALTVEGVESDTGVATIVIVVIKQSLLQSTNLPTATAPVASIRLDGVAVDRSLAGVRVRLSLPLRGEQLHISPKLTQLVVH